MKKCFIILAVVFFTAAVWAQVPDLMSYQAVIRNSNGELHANAGIGMQISILQESDDGQAVFVERHFPETNENGLVSVKIGGGTAVSGSFMAIEWGSGAYFIKTEIDLTGGASYTITGTSQMLSVPYALHAKSAAELTGSISGTQIADLEDHLPEETDPVFSSSTASSITTRDISTWDGKQDRLTAGDGIDITGNIITATPLTYQPGDFAHGGVVFYVEPSGTKGLVVSIEDLNEGIGIRWGRGGPTFIRTNARGDGIYAGKLNTSLIISVQAAKDYFDDHAALVCTNYSGGGYGDWYLPSIAEMVLVYENRSIIEETALANGGSAFVEQLYWTSNEGDDTQSREVFGVNFNNGAVIDMFKGDPLHVRAVRAF